jgi:hypothetical protein
MARQLLSSTLSNGWACMIPTIVTSANTKIRPFAESQLGALILPKGVLI